MSDFTFSSKNVKFGRKIKVLKIYIKLRFQSQKGLNSFYQTPCLKDFDKTSFPFYSVCIHTKYYSSEQAELLH